MIDHSYNPNTFSDEKSIASHSFINTGFPGGVEFSTCVNLGPHSIFLRSSLMALVTSCYYTGMRLLGYEIFHLLSLL